jgi:hypothetical protein
MFKQIIILLLIFPFVASAQKIKLNEYDKFIKQRRIETTASSVKTAKDVDLAISFKSVGPTLYTLLNGTGIGAGTVGLDEQAIFLLENDSTVIAKSIGVQSFDYVNNKNQFKHQYNISLQDVETLSRNKIKSIRKYDYKGFVDISVSSKNAESIKKLSTLFINELKKEKVFFAQKTVKLEDVSKYVGDSVMVFGKVYGGRYLPNTANKPTLLNIGAQYPNQLLTVVIYEQDRKNFETSPEIAYKDKEIFIIGKVELYNNKPQIVIRNKDQLLNSFANKTF